MPDATIQTHPAPRQETPTLSPGRGADRITSSGETASIATCPDCEDGTRWVSRHGGNDPDVRALRCETCDGTGEIEVRCECCGELAAGVFDGARYCAGHAVELVGVSA